MRPGHRILDLGCGEGRHTHEAARRRAQTVAVDMARGELQRTKYVVRLMQRRREAEGDAEFVLADAERLPFPTAVFDRIICSEVLEHIPDHRAGLRELRRVLKPRGALALSVPTCATEALYWRLSWEYWHSPGGHIRVFRPAQLAADMREAGFRLFALRHKHALHTPYWLLRCAFGLRREDACIPRAYYWLLERQITRGSVFMDRLEALADFIFPKSIVLYARPAHA